MHIHNTHTHTHNTHSHTHTLTNTYTHINKHTYTHTLTVHPNPVSKDTSMHTPLIDGQVGAGPMLAVVGVEVLHRLQVVAAQQRPCLLREAEEFLPCAQLLLWAFVDANGQGVVGVHDVHEEHKPGTPTTLS